MDWDALVKTLGPRLHRYFCFCFTSEAADDLVQETLIRLVRRTRAGDYNSHKGSIEVFAFGIAHFVRWEARKKPRRLPCAGDNETLANLPSGDISANEQLEQREQRHKLRRAIGDLSEPEQAILNLMIDRDLTLPEIAAILAMPLGTVKSHMHRAKQALKTRLNAEEER